VADKNGRQAISKSESVITGLTGDS